MTAEPPGKSVSGLPKQLIKVDGFVGGGGLLQKDPLRATSDLGSSLYFYSITYPSNPSTVLPIIFYFCSPATAFGGLHPYLAFHTNGQVLLFKESYDIASSRQGHRVHTPD